MNHNLRAAQSLVWAAFLVLIGFNLVWFVQRQLEAQAITARLAEPPENWLQPIVTRVVDDVIEIGANPMIYFEYEVKRPIEVWVNVRTTNLYTGEERCTGRTVAVILEVAQRTETTVPLAQLAGLEDCDWPQGEYQIGLTWNMNDAVTHSPLRAIRNDAMKFRVVPAQP